MADRKIKLTMMICLILSVSACVPTYASIRSGCEQQYVYGTPRYLDCVADGQADAERKREALRAFGQGLQQAGQSMQQSNHQVNCVTTCNFGTCYTTCR
jgi:hypothetical protein